ncbi:HIT family protein [Spiroplasma endosymbiont of Asaphidion curtum]|uniref:HIT family protein n=1 Tax=Spiroplasma endosymbiont of Asaphidion curtum TaxID=3066281 RepID=UPI00313EF763
MNEQSCLFCKIILHQIPSYIIYEDEHTIAFLDIMPVDKGHTLVVPKIHSTNFINTNDEIISFVNITAKKVAKRIEIQLNTSAINFISNNGILVGQTIEHYHLHIIPKYSSNSGLQLPKNQIVVDSKKLTTLQKKLKIN